MPRASAPTSRAPSSATTARAPPMRRVRRSEIGRAHVNSSHDQISYAVFCLKKKKHTSELQSRSDLVCRLLLEKKKKLGSPLPTVLSLFSCTTSHHDPTLVTIVLRLHHPPPSH